MFDIITFGSASQDIIVKPKKLTLLKYNPPSREASARQGKESSQKEVCFPMGSKIDLEDIQFFSGGGGTNTAATFALQGFKTAYCGAVGADISGQQIIAELKKRKINTDFVITTNKKPTNHSIVISEDKEDRTVLAYRGASELMGDKDIPWKKLKALLRPRLRTGKAKWMYLAPLTGLLLASLKPTGEGGLSPAEAVAKEGATLFEVMVNFAQKNNIRLAVNPGMAQLSMPNFPEIAKKIDVVFMNQEEASFLTKIPVAQEQEIFKRLDGICRGVAVMTKGGDGVMVSDGKYRYSAVPPADRIVVDTLGAGDAFASGFLSEFMRGGDIEKSIQLGMGNSVGNLSQVGAKTGLLKKGQSFVRVPVTKEECDNNVCIVK